MSALDILIRVLVAAALGGVIGLEREIREHTAGFRTHILVAVGAAAFALASTYGLEGTEFDPNRISANIVVGMGFLGAGAIIRYGASVRGLTTAASLWTVAAVGLLSGQGYYTAALITAGLIAVTLYLLRLLEDHVIYRLVSQPLGIRVRFHGSGLTSLTQLMAALHGARVVIREMATPAGGGEDSSVHLLLRLPRTMKSEDLLLLVTGLEGVAEVSLD